MRNFLKETLKNDTLPSRNGPNDGASPEESDGTLRGAGNGNEDTVEGPIEVEGQIEEGNNFNREDNEDDFDRRYNPDEWESDFVPVVSNGGTKLKGEIGSSPEGVVTKLGGDVGDVPKGVGDDVGSLSKDGGESAGGEASTKGKD